VTRILLSRLFSAVLIACCIYLPTAHAQQVTAGIKGSVTDVTGAAIPGAGVAATNVQTGIKATVESGSDGSFQFLTLPVGDYTVTVTKNGFATFTENAIHLVLNQVFALPVTLKVGQVSQSVEVRANAAQVETNVTQLGNVIQSATIQDLPLNGRDWTQLQQLNAGVVSTSDRMADAYATNGSESQQNSFLINGIDSMDLPLNEVAVIPSPDSIQEFNLIQSTINPEYDRNSGAVLNAITKSGTNEFHGDAFDFYRDTFLDGRNIYQNAKPVFHQNQFGGTLGGPIWKDHTFFFVSYQGTRNREPQPGEPSQTPVYSNAQRSGYFTDLATSTGSSPIPLIGDDGATYAAGTPYATIFRNNFIPTADMNPLAVKLLNQYVPASNSPGNLYSFNPIQTTTIDQGIFRLDHTFGQKDTMWVTGTIQDEPTIDTLPFIGATLPGFASQNLLATKEFAADWTHTINPTTLNEFRVGYLRYNYDAVAPVTPTLPASYGFTGITPQNAPGAGLPTINVNGLFSLGFSSDGPQPRLDETYQLTDSISKVIGNHTLKFGFDGKRYNVDNPFFGNNNGTYSFGGAGIYTTGDAGADFLLGIPDSYTQSSGGWIVARTYEYYGYAQDSWKVNDHLTLNYGLGYQVDTPLVNQHFDRLDVNCFLPGEQSTVFPTAPTGVDFPGDPGCTSSGYHPRYDHIAPRFGFAYSPGDNQKSVIRGGFGVYYNRSEEELVLQNLGAIPFSITSVGAGSLAGGSPAFANPFQDIATGATVANPFPFTPPSKGSTVDFTQFYPDFMNTISPSFTAPYAMNFNLNYQRELPGAMIFQIAYVGALGRHLELTYEGNPITPAGTAACAVDPTCVGERVEQQVAFPSHTEYIPGNEIASVGIQATDGNSSYHSMQVTLRKNFTHGLMFLANYTWSHSIDDTSGFENSGFGNRGEDPFNFAVDRGDSAFDARQRLVVSYDYELPHLSRFWNNGLVREAFDGWHISGITTLQSGFPINLSETDFNSLQCSAFQFYGCWDAPNVTGSTTTYNPRNSVLTNTVSPPAAGVGPQNYYYFNPNAFGEEAIGQLGDAGRDAFHGPGILNTDLNLFKRFYVDASEKRSLELRLEAYNVFNHTQFSLANTSSGGSNVDGNIYDANFGRVLAANIGRTIQLAAKFYF